MSCRICHSGEIVYKEGLCEPCWIEYPNERYKKVDLIQEFKFVECSVCASKSGSPVLCSSCLANRAIISELIKKLTPREWSKTMSDVWHQSIPDLNKAFERLRELNL